MNGLELIWLRCQTKKGVNHWLTTCCAISCVSVAKSWTSGDCSTQIYLATVCLQIYSVGIKGDITSSHSCRLSCALSNWRLKRTARWPRYAGRGLMCVIAQFDPPNVCFVFDAIVVSGCQVEYLLNLINDVTEVRLTDYYLLDWPSDPREPTDYNVACVRRRAWAQSRDSLWRESEQEPRQSQKDEDAERTSEEPGQTVT